jgi:hypothetical protein
MKMIKRFVFRYVMREVLIWQVNDFIASLAGSAPALAPAGIHGHPSGIAKSKSDSKGLEKEARDALRATKGYMDAPEVAGDESKDEEEVEDFETEDEILLKALEGAELDAETRSKIPGQRPEDNDEVPYEKETEQDILARARALATAQSSLPPSSTGENEPGFSFPSLPTHIPTEESEETDAKASAKMALLLGLSLPHSQPGPPRLPSPPKEIRKPGQGWNLPGYKDDNDEDPDSWCCTSSHLNSGVN